MTPGPQLVLDARTVYARSRRGTGKAMVALYRELADLRPEWRIFAVHREEGDEDPFADVQNITPRQVDIRGDRLGLWPNARLPLAAWGSDLLHCPANTAPCWSPAPVVLTVHDLIPLEPDFRTAESDAWARRVWRSARRAVSITTPSQYSKTRICGTFEIPEEKVHVIPWAANPGLAPVTDDTELQRVRKAHGLARGERFVLAFGGLDPRKNTRRLIGAWMSLPETVRREVSLLIVGMRDPLLTELRSEIDCRQMRGRCLLTGHIPEADLPGLLSGTDLLCFPTLCEGFGLPVLDAFACGTAVVTSRVSSVPEVAGRAVLYVDPTDETSIAEGIENLLTDDHRRAELARAGRQRGSQFSWRATAEAYVHVFEDVLGLLPTSDSAAVASPTHRQ